MSYTIAGTGYALPKRVVTNGQLSEIVDTSNEWIITRTGIEERRVLTDESLTELALQAAKMAMVNAKIKSTEIDLIICATIRSDTITPSLACTIAEYIGCTAPAFDVNAACVGLIYAMEIADSFMASGKAKNVLILTAEAMSKLVDWTDRSTCVLFGDGAGAVVLQPGRSRLACSMQSAANNGSILMPNTEGENSPFNKHKQDKMVVQMDGGEVYKFAVSAFAKRSEEVCAMAGIVPTEIDWILPHQANLRIIDAALKKMGVHKERALTNIHKYGNMSATSIMVLLAEEIERGRFKRGDKLLLVSFGAGLTSGALLIEY